MDSSVQGGLLGVDESSCFFPVVYVVVVCTNVRLLVCLLHEGKRGRAHALKQTIETHNHIHVDNSVPVNTQMSTCNVWQLQT